jgi:hypothetical protein
MKKLILALALIPSFAVAEFLPDGCYVAHYYRTDPCWYAQSGLYQWNKYSAQQNQYGSPVSTIALTSFEETRQKNTCINNLSAAQSQVTAYANEYNAVVADKAFLIGAYGKINSYAKKLKKACGSKCSKIKAPKL